MEFDFSPDVLSALAPEQTNALLCALFLASVTGPTVDADEVQRFRDSVAKLPFTPNAAAVADALSSGRARYEATDPGAYGPWLEEIATQLTGPSLREKTLAIMGIVSPDYLRAEDPGVLGAAIVAFGVSSDRLTAIRQAIGEDE